MTKHKWFFGNTKSWAYKDTLAKSKSDVMEALEIGTGATVYLFDGKSLVSVLNAETILRKFACDCALDVIHLWNPPDVVLKFLRGDESLRGAAREAAWEVAREAAWEVVWEVVRGAARGAAWEVAREAAREAARSKQRKRLEEMLLEGIRLNTNEENHANLPIYG